MKKVFFLSAIAALALSSCSSDETLQAPVQQDGAIAFDIYTGRAVNRAVSTTLMKKNDRQNITTEILQASKDGFGVFAYETGAQKFQSYLANNTYPTYMFNQQVQYDKDLTGTVSNWVYTPVKYWPNDDSNVTFQAYAPWTESTENVLFDVKYNGVGIRYALDIKNIPTNNYDLLWGENKDTQKCFYDQTKPGIADKTMFHFQHALSKVDFTVSYNADKMDCTTPDGKLDENTEIVIRSIKLLGTLPSQGVLSLYDGSWTVEKVVENKFEFDTDFFGYTKAIGTSNKTLTGDGTDPGPVDVARRGVLDKDVQKLYANSSVMLIPAKSPVKLEISYDVVTKAWTDPVTGDVFPGHTKNITIVSDNIPDYWGNTHAGDTDLPYADADGNVIHPESGAGQSGKPGVFSFDAGMWTTINIHLGMTSVKLDADVQAWDQSESGSIDMPANAEETVLVPKYTWSSGYPLTGGVNVESIEPIEYYKSERPLTDYNKPIPDGIYWITSTDKWYKYTTNTAGQTVVEALDAPQKFKVIKDRVLYLESVADGATVDEAGYWFWDASDHHYGKLFKVTVTETEGPSM